MCLSKVSFPQGSESHCDPGFMPSELPSTFLLVHWTMLDFVVMIKTLENELINFAHSFRGISQSWQAGSSKAWMDVAGW